ncbi:hemoglobin subunit beta-1-like [Sebastes umbrosus]|uniref:hemoglobin subunit beta-1-like n=1 Tax=Sebastes umbrosus TaxID=72105 RepID=UPI0018A003F0|nr:hemoglobin subunit beta-1-like [Sebastes umbrosus]
MVEWTDQERSIISSIFSTLDYDDIGPKALSRCLIVYPWTRRHFVKSFGDIKTNEAIKANKQIAAHGIKVLHGLDRGLKNMDNMKATYAQLSVLHSEKLHVDPDNFRVFTDCLTIVVAAKMGTSFNAQTQAAFQKFLTVAVSALGRQYH